MKDTVCRMSLAMALLAGSAVAQSWQPAEPPGQSDPVIVYPDAPSAARAASDASASPAPRGDQGAAKPAVECPVLNFGETADAKYTLAMGAMFATSVVTVEMTNQCLNQHTCSFLPGPLRSRAAMYGAGLPLEFGVGYLSFKLKQHGHKWWMVPPLLVTAANIYVARHSAMRLR